MEAVSGIRIYECCDGELYAAASAVEARAEAAKDAPEEVAEFLGDGDAPERTDGWMDKVIFVDTDENEMPAESRTMRAELQRRIDAGDKFPCHFASGNI